MVQQRPEKCSGSKFKGIFQCCPKNNVNFLLSFRNVKHKWKNLIIKYIINIIPSQTNTPNQKLKKKTKQQTNMILSQIRISIVIWIHEGHNKKERLMQRVITSFIYDISSKSIKSTTGLSGFTEFSFSKVLFYGNTTVWSRWTWIVWMLDMVHAHLNLQCFTLIVSVTSLVIR